MTLYDVTMVVTYRVEEHNFSDAHEAGLVLATPVDAPDSLKEVEVIEVRKV